MCGVAGILRFDGIPVEPQQLKRMTDAIRHRGPDGEGHWVNARANLGLGHRRLSILDLSDLGAQPMHYGGRYIITFNGEIYNYIEIKESLMAKGHTFLSDCDTEVLLAGYREYGEEVLQYLDGMFAFAIWDEQEQTLFCARDRFGEKPFFYASVPGHSFIFSSEIKGLLAFGLPPKINQAMLFNYLAYDVVQNSNAPEETFYCDVLRLEAAHSLTIDASGLLTKRQYWSIRSREFDHDISFEAACERFKELFFQSVSRRLRSDVPVGSSLSGGLDSSSIVCVIDELIRGTGQAQKTFSARFDDASLDEGRYIEMVAAATGVDSYVTWPNADTLRDDLKKITYHQEEPFGSASIVAQWAVMKLAKQEGVTVLLDGQGADETLGGYTHYFRPYFLSLYRNQKQLRREVAAYKKLHGRTFDLGPEFALEACFPGLRRLTGRVRRRLMRPAYLGYLHPDFSAAYKLAPPPFKTFNDLNQTLMYATQGYGLEKLLRYSDRNSMAFAREVRLPFLSHELVEFLFTLPAAYKIGDGWTKRILRQALAPLLPEKIAWRADKLGFAPPQKKWMQHTPIQEMVHDSRKKLADEGIVLSGPANQADVNDSNQDWKCLMAAEMLEFASDGVAKSRQ